MRVQRPSSRRRPESITLNLASMIDLTFLLLIYFMVTTVLANPEDRLSAALQTRSDSAVGPTADIQPQIVNVIMHNDAPAYMMGGEIFTDRPSLTAALRHLYRPAGVFVRATGVVPVRAVAAALQAARDANFEQVTYVPAE